MGDELFYLLKAIENNKLTDCVLVDQDYSDIYIDYIYEQLIKKETRSLLEELNCKVILFDGDACSLPLESNQFDYCHHFGGINRFSSIEKAISEMLRVLKSDSTSGIMFSDESVAPWLRTKDVGKMVISNNALYGAPIPLALLPESAKDVKIEWICQNCFYKISFGKGFSTNNINPNIVHKSPRGGSMSTRYEGSIEGINPEVREAIYKKARELEISYSEYIENILKESLV